MVEKVEKAASSKVSKPKKAVVASHPATSVMVKEAIENLKDRKGSSLIAIKKYLATNYKWIPVFSNKSANRERGHCFIF